MAFINPKRTVQLEKLQSIIEYSFKKLSLLDTALTHSSFSGSKGHDVEHNERLEFIGDSILDMIISLHLYKKCKHLPEGQLTRMRASIVCESSLREAAEKLQLGEFLQLSKGEEHTGGRRRASILADAFEALLAAIYLDGGINKATHFVISVMGDAIEASIQGRSFSDYKSYLQEQIQKNSTGKLIYKTLKEEGPDHDKLFEMALYLEDELIGTGSGRSKKDAQQAAARAAIEKMGLSYEQ